MMFLLLAAVPSYADTDRSGFGIHGGLNFNDFDVTSNTVTNAKNNTTGWLAGIHFEGEGPLTLRLEVNYSVRGYEYANLVNVKYNYLEIPLLVKFSPIPGPIKVFVEGGGSASLKLSTTVDTLGSSVTYDTNSSTWDFGLLAGAGLGVMVGPNTLLSVEGRYLYGLTNVSDDATVTIHTRGIQALASLTFF